MTINLKFEIALDAIQTYYLEGAGEVPFDKLEAARNAICDLFGITMDEYLDDLERRIRESENA